MTRKAEFPFSYFRISELSLTGQTFSFFAQLSLNMPLADSIWYGNSILHILQYSEILIKSRYWDISKYAFGWYHMKILYYTYFSTIFCKFNEKILGHFKICLLMEICLYMEILYYIFYSVESTRQNILCYEYAFLVSNMQT